MYCQLPLTRSPWTYLRNCRPQSTNTLHQEINMRGLNIGLLFLAVMTELPYRFSLAEERSLGKCDLQCGNGGECKVGQEKTSKEQYCHCPTGYSGTLCEIKFVTCAKGENETCFNENPCMRDVDADGNPYFHCQCDPTMSDLSAPYATRFCEHAATAFCKPPDHNSLGPTGDSYCANSGKCKPTEKGKHHSGCLCAPGWSGVYCEVADSVKGATDNAIPQGSTPVSETVTRTSAGGGSRFKRFIIAFFSFFVVLVTLACVGLLFEHGRSGRRRVRQRYRRTEENEGGEEGGEDLEVIAEQELITTSSQEKSSPEEAIHIRSRSSGELA